MIEKLGKYCVVCKHRMSDHWLMGQMLVNPEVSQHPASLGGALAYGCWVMKSTYDSKR